jgi:hypothetical protein
MSLEMRTTENYISRSRLHLPTILSLASKDPHHDAEEKYIGYEEEWQHRELGFRKRDLGTLNYTC